MARNDLSNPLQEIDYSAEPSEYASGLHSIDLGSAFDDARPYLCDYLQEKNENDDDLEPEHGLWDDQRPDHGTPKFFRAPVTEGSHEGDESFDAGFMAPGCQGREQSPVQVVAQQENERQLFTTNISDTYSSWQPRHLVGSKYELGTHITDGQVQDVDQALSGFWTPHKLY